jgi:hypothetical protein
VLINPIIRTRTRYFRHAYHPIRDNINIKANEVNETANNTFGKHAYKILLLKIHAAPMPITEYRDRVGHTHVCIFEVVISNIGQKTRYYR